MIIRIIKNTNVIEHINMTIYKNEQLCIYGMNGSGKTILIRKIIGEIEKRQKIKKIDKKEIIKYAYQLGMERDLEKNTQNLSSGQKKKLIFIHLIKSKKKIWLLDEPDNFIDGLTIEWTNRKIIEHLNTNGIIIITRNKWKNEETKNIGLSGFEPLTFRLSSEHSTTKL